QRSLESSLFRSKWRVRQYSKPLQARLLLHPCTCEVALGEASDLQTRHDADQPACHCQDLHSAKRLRNTPCHTNRVFPHFECTRVTPGYSPFRRRSRSRLCWMQSPCSFHQVPHRTNCSRHSAQLLLHSACSGEARTAPSTSMQ